eukprot:scaffold42271_cov33-Attheya_sp.AAC.3
MTDDQIATISDRIATMDHHEPPQPPKPLIDATDPWPRVYYSTIIMPRKKKGRPTYGTKKKEKGHSQNNKRLKVNVLPQHTDTGTILAEPKQIQGEQAGSTTTFNTIGNDDRQSTIRNYDRLQDRSIPSTITKQRMRRDLLDQAILLSTTGEGQRDYVRQTIAFFYIEKLQMPDKEVWSGKLGTIHLIMKSLSLIIISWCIVYWRILYFAEIKIFHILGRDIFDHRTRIFS